MGLAFCLWSLLVESEVRRFRCVLRLWRDRRGSKLCRRRVCRRVLNLLSRSRHVVHWKRKYPVEAMAKG